MSELDRTLQKLNDLFYEIEKENEELKAEVKRLDKEVGKWQKMAKEAEEK